MNDHRDQDESMDDATADMLGELHDEVDTLRSHLDDAHDRIAELEARPVDAPAPAGNTELQALATCYRTAVRNGHPDAPKHLENLLSALGA